jgi:septal ring factor EnvC (AmiA/AmiB activator)
MKMNVFTCCVALLLTGSLGLNMEASMASSLTFDDAAAKKRPVSKVITLLKDMLKELEKDAADDEELYDKMACWCSTNKKEKTKSIADAQASVSASNTKIEELTATSSRLTTEIENLQSEIANNQKALDSATAIRQKQLAEFNGESTDLTQSIASLKSAVVVMKKNSFLQMPREGVVASVQDAMKMHESLLTGVLTNAERKAVTAFIQDPSYAPQSGEIFGILGQMKETFEANLDASQKEETATQRAYEELKAAKEAEVGAGQAQKDTKDQELADAQEKNALAKQDVDDTTASLEADQEFIAMLKEKCSQTDSEWEERQKTRQLEIEACSKALSVLSADDAHDLFTKTFNPSLLQKDAVMHSDRRSEASKLLSSASHRVKNPRLATLAMKVRLDAFTRVKESIQGMVTELTKEKADETKHRDYCTDKFSSNEQQTEKKGREKADILAKITTAEQQIEDLKAEVDTLNSEVAEMRSQLKKAKETRDKEEKEFQTTLADQRATEKLLTKALHVLQGFYSKKAAAALVQVRASQDPPPPPGFEGYKKNEAAGGVMGILQQIINDAKAMEVEVTRDEKDALKAYDSFVKDTTESIDEKSKSIVNKSDSKATKETDFVEAKKGKASVLLELEQADNEKAALHAECDFIVNNFDIRQTALDEEMEALKQAKAILSGASFGSFL